MWYNTEVLGKKRRILASLRYWVSFRKEEVTGGLDYMLLDVVHPVESGDMVMMRAFRCSDNLDSPNDSRTRACFGGALGAPKS